MCVCVCVCVVFVQSCWLFNRAASFNEGPLELGCNKHALQVCLFICCVTSFAFVYLAFVYFCFPLFVLLLLLLLCLFNRVASFNEVPLELGCNKH